MKYLSQYELIVQVLRCLGFLLMYIIPCILVLLPIRFLTKVPSFVFRKLLHIGAFTGVCLMILWAESWQAAAITSGLLSAFLYPILHVAEKQPWFARLFVQKFPGEIKKSMLLLFLMFTAVIAVAWGIFDHVELAAASILMWGVGDAAAALVGIPFGLHKVRCRFTDGKKSWEGSFAMLFSSFAVGVMVLTLTQKTGWPRALLSAGIGSLIGAATELFSPSEYDTVTVPVMILTVLLMMKSV